MEETKMDANRCAIELHKLIERFEADVAIYCMTMTLGQLLADQAEDQEHGARLVEKAMSLLAERLMVNLDVRDQFRSHH